MERSCLSELDRLPTVVGVSSQPMWISWGEGGVRRQQRRIFLYGSLTVRVWLWMCGRLI